MSRILRYLLELDRRWVFLILAVTVVAAELFKGSKQIAVVPTSTVKAAFDEVEALQPGDPVLISFDYDPSAAGELDPTAVAMLRQAFRKKLRVVGMTLWPKGVSAIEALMEKVAAEFKNSDGGRAPVLNEDYVFLGYNPGDRVAVLSVSQDIYSAYAKSTKGVPTRGLKVLQGIKNLKDFKLLAVIGAGDSLEWWIAYGQGRTGVNTVFACTAVMAPDQYTFLQTKQVKGLVGGLAGAWDYEALVSQPGDATPAVFTQTVVHALIVFLIVFCNVVYFLSRLTGGKR